MPAINLFVSPIWKFICKNYYAGTIFTYINYTVKSISLPQVRPKIYFSISNLLIEQRDLGRFRIQHYKRFTWANKSNCSMERRFCDCDLRYGAIYTIIISNTMIWGKLVIKCPRKPREVCGIPPSGIPQTSRGWGTFNH